SDESTKGSLVVLAASSMAPVFAESKKQFLTTHPCVTDISFSYGSSATLAAQIVNGSPADVFVSASEKNMNTVLDSGRTINTTLFARNSGEIMVNASSRFVDKITSIASLSESSNAGIKVGLCVATAPCGALADSILEKSGSTRKALADTESPSVEDVVSKIEMGELDAGIVYHSDCVNAQKNKRAICVPIPADANASNSYYVAALNTRNVTQQFVDFVSSPAFTTSLQSKYGFLAP
ncbi:MAG: molybdate ABC transporter substrate-binding protein, partial [Ilumatobacteraceae bacterium]|nr:molybdate ABC transporter substrate-binding protein [Ilumatobacteraceae bacterium]